jgi:hypothetical protein
MVQEILISEHEMSQIEEINSSMVMSRGGITNSKRRSIVGKLPSRMSDQSKLIDPSQYGFSDNLGEMDYIP